MQARHRLRVLWYRTLLKLGLRRPMTLAEMLGPDQRVGAAVRRRAEEALGSALPDEEKLRAAAHAIWHDGIYDHAIEVEAASGGYAIAVRAVRRPEQQLDDGWTPRSMRDRALWEQARGAWRLARLQGPLPVVELRVTVAYRLDGGGPIDLLELRCDPARLARDRGFASVDPFATMGSWDSPTSEALGVAERLGEQLEVLADHTGEVVFSGGTLHRRPE